MNPLFFTDFYKVGHWQQYPEGTQFVYSNFTPRSSKYFNQKFDDKKIVFFGLQAVLADLCDKWEEFFHSEKSIVVDSYKKLIGESLGIKDVQTAHIERLHDLGHLPIKVKALPEGSKVNVGVPVFTITNTLPEFFWVVNYLETYLSAELWKLSTNATIAAHYKKILLNWAEKTGGDKSFVNLQGHDFSYRGLSGTADAAMSGMGHLLSFMGTDTIPAIFNAKKYYNAQGPVGVSVPATEHSIMCSGTKEGELATYRRLINDLYPTGIVSIVSDTWDFWKVITEFTVELKDDILARKPNDIGLAKVVFRPDSGDPVDIICGYSKFVEYPETYEEHELRRVFNIIDGKIVYYRDIGHKHDHEFEVIYVKHDDPTPEEKGAVECLWDVFGGTINEKGYKVLNERVGLIYGDSITLERADEICRRLEAKGFASTNVVFGIGSYTYQMNTRDTFGFAMKATSVVINDKRQAIFKDPKTDGGTKKSAKGLLRVEREDGEFVLYDQQTEEQENQGLLKEVFRDGMFVGPGPLTSFEKIKAVLAEQMS